MLSEEHVTEIRSAFSVCDSNGDGVVDWQELRTMVSQIQGSAADQDTINQLLSSCDANGDGVISFDEFEAAMSAWIYSGSAGTQKRKLDPSEGSPVGMRRRKLHQEISTFFRQFSSPAEHLEDFVDQLEADEQAEDHTDLVAASRFGSDEPPASPRLEDIEVRSTEVRSRFIARRV